MIYLATDCPPLLTAIERNRYNASQNRKRMNVETQTPRQLTTMPGYEYAPIWSPDGNWIAFTATKDGGESDLYAIRADGSGLTLLAGEGIHSVEAEAWLASRP